MGLRERRTKTVLIQRIRRRQGKLEMTPLGPAGRTIKKPPARERLAALQYSYAMSGPALAVWCRERCVFEHQSDPGDVTPLMPENAALRALIDHRLSRRSLLIVANTQRAAGC